MYIRFLFCVFIVNFVSVNILLAQEDLCLNIPDAIVRRYCYGDFDINKDRKISSSEALRVTQLIFSYTGIRMLDGLDSFPNLSRIVCRECNDLVYADLSDTNIQVISTEDFSSCGHLFKIFFPSTLTRIEDRAFENCPIHEMSLPESLEYIGVSAFDRCSNLRYLVIPESVHTLEAGVFADCTKLCDVVLPSKLTQINNFLFSRCESLKSIVIPSTVRSIGAFAFESCTSLDNIELPEGVEEIKVSAFINCEQLKKIKLPKSLKSIQHYVFSDCESLTSVEVSENVVSIATDAFENCESLVKFVCKAQLPPTLVGDAPFLNPSVKVYVPVHSLDLYQRTVGWRDLTLVGYE